MFCRKCGEQLPENAKFCTKCGSNTQNIESNITQLNQNNMNVNTKPKKRFWPIYLKLVGIVFLLDIILSFVNIFLNAKGITIDENMVTIIRGFRIFIPISILLYGWIPVLIYVKSQ